MCNSITLPYSRNLHNMVNQIYFNKISRKRKKSLMLDISCGSFLSQNP